MHTGAPLDHPVEVPERVLDKSIRVTVAERKGPGLGLISIDAVVLTMSGEVRSSWPLADREAA
jgi:hypothetical protein